MKQDLLVRDILPYIEMWTGVIMIVIMIFIYHIWKTGKKHPEMFQPDLNSDTLKQRQQKNEFRRQCNNKSMLALSMLFVWVRRFDVS